MVVLLISLLFMFAEIKVLQSNMTLEEIHNKEAKLSNEVGHLKNLVHLSLIWLSFKILKKSIHII